MQFLARRSCGCCEVGMEFRSEESAREAFARAGLGNSVSVTDDVGVTHDQIDTFYGARNPVQEQDPRCLQWLTKATRNSGEAQ